MKLVLGGMRRCSRCKKMKDLSAFYKASHSCRPCEADRKRTQAYGITRAAFDRLIIEQSGRCAICLGPDPNDSDTAWFQVDHDHETGMFRGLICARCNRMVGHANLDEVDAAIQRLRAGAEYLEAWRAMTEELASIREGK